MPSGKSIATDSCGRTLWRKYYADAEPLFKRALAIRENALRVDHPAVGATLNNLATLYQAQGRYADAEPAYKRSLTIKEKAHVLAYWRSLCPPGILEQSDDRIVIVVSVVTLLRESLRQQGQAERCLADSVAGVDLDASLEQ